MIRTVTRGAIAACLILALSGGVAAETASNGDARDSGGTKGVQTGAKLEVTATTVGEIKFKLTGEAKVPFLAGDGPLTSDNNVRLKLSGDVSPVSTNAACEATWTPIAFMEIVTGASIGSGWNLPVADGLRINEREGLHDQRLNGDALEGAVWSVKGGVALQGDFAAIKPGDWNHVVFRTYHAGMYRALTSASDSESWLYEADEGENRNAWRYYGNYLLAYRMPVKLNLVGILIEEDQYLQTLSGGDYWGDGLSWWTFSLLGNYAFTERLSLTALIQAQTTRNFKGDTGDYGFYQDRALDASDERGIKFYRAVLTLAWKLK